MMSRREAALLEPIEGQVIPGSRVMALVSLAVGPIATGLAGMGLVIWWSTGVGAPGSAVLACAGGVVLGLVVTAWAVRELCLPTRLVLGGDAVQIVRGKRRVQLHLPYANVAAVAYEKQDASRSIRFDLLDADDPRTYLARVPLAGQAFALSLRASNLPVYACNPWDVFEALGSRLDEFRSRGLTQQRPSK
jgi:hypothetical protein